MNANLNSDSNPIQFRDAKNWRGLLSILINSNIEPILRGDAASYLVEFCDCEGSSTILNEMELCLKDCTDDSLQSNLTESISNFRYFYGRTEDLNFLISTFKQGEDSVLRAHALEFLKPHADGPRQKEIKLAQSMDQIAVLNDRNVLLSEFGAGSGDVAHEVRRKLRESN
jgi:hypothetical protein